jgi:DNA-binding transcriptional LysR family regulator
MLTLRQIEVFRAVVRTGTLVAAADALAISQPTISRMVLRIEDQVGARLFDRVKGRLKPTREALRILTEVDRAFDDLQAAIGRAVRVPPAGIGSLRIGTSPSVGRHLVPTAVATLTERHPHLALRLDVLSVAQILPYLTDQQGDVVVTLFPLLHQGIVTTPLGRGAPVLVIPRAWRDLGAEPQAFATQPWIVFETLSVHGGMLQRVLRDHGIEPERLHVVRFAESAIALAEAGVGATIVDSFSAAAANRDRAAVLPIATERHFEVFMHRAPGDSSGRQIEAFQAALAAAIADSAASALRPEGAGQRR